jgi:hypothetical protein
MLLTKDFGTNKNKHNLILIIHKVFNNKTIMPISIKIRTSFIKLTKLIRIRILIKIIRDSLLIKLKHLPRSFNNQCPKILVLLRIKTNNSNSNFRTNNSNLIRTIILLDLFSISLNFSFNMGNNRMGLTRFPQLSVLQLISISIKIVWYPNL